MICRSILITGCSSGIGYCVAHGLQQRGHRVIASCRRAEDVERLQQEGLNCIQLDLDDSRSIADALEQSLALVTGLVPLIGYDRAAAIAHEAYRSGRTIRELVREQDLVDEETLNRVLS